MNLFFDYQEDAVSAIKKAGFVVADDEEIVWRRKGRQLLEIAIVKKLPAVKD